MAEPDPLTDLLRIPSELRELVRDAGSHLEVDKQLIQQLREQRARRHVMTAVPSTPRFLARDVGGVAVGKGQGRFPHVTFDQLRNIKERSPLLASIHGARQYQIRRMAKRWDGTPGHVGIRVVHKDRQDWKATPPTGFEPWIQRFESVLWKPSESYGYPTLAGALASLEDDLLTINRPAVELLPSILDPRRIVQWRPIDGALIWETMLWVERWKADHPRWSGGYDRGRLSDADALDLLSQQMDADLHGAQYVLVREGQAEAVYPPGRLLLAPIQNRTDIRYVGYPPSHVEQAMAYIAAFMNTFEYNANLFTKGMLTEMAIGLPADMHDDDADAVIDMFRENSQGVDRAHQPIFIPIPRGGGEITKIDLKSLPKDMGFETWASLLMSGACGIYRMHTSAIGVKPWSGGSGPSLNEGNETEQIGLAQEEGLQGDLGHLVDNVLTPIAQRCHPDLLVIVEWGDFDPKKEAEVYEIHGRLDMTRNEIRIERGGRPHGFFLDDEKYEAASDEEKGKHDDNPWNWPTDPGFANAINQAKMREQQAAQGQQQQQQPGMPDDGYGGNDDGFGGATGAAAAPPYGTPSNGQPGQSPPQQAMAKAARTVHVHVHDGTRRYP